MTSKEPKKNSKNNSSTRRVKRTGYDLTGREELYKIWCKMVDDTYIARDGSRRKKEVCEEWLDFDNFAKWADYWSYFDGVTLAKLDNRDSYNPDNCIFEPPKKISSVDDLYYYDGVPHTLNEWADISGIKIEVLRSRVNTYGWGIHKALLEPVGKRKWSGKIPERYRKT